MQTILCVCLVSRRRKEKVITSFVFRHLFSFFLSSSATRNTRAEKGPERKHLSRNSTRKEREREGKAMGRLEIDPFLTQLAALFKKTRNSGSVFVTMKKVSVTQTPRRRKNKDTERPEDCCLIRVQGPSGTKFSTIVRSSSLSSFPPFLASSSLSHTQTARRSDPIQRRGQVPGVVQQHAQGLHGRTQDAHPGWDQKEDCQEGLRASLPFHPLSLSTSISSCDLFLSLDLFLAGFVLASVTTTQQSETETETETGG